MFSKLYRTIIAEKNEIKLSSLNFRYFRYEKNRISNIDIFEISIFIENIDISHQPIISIPYHYVLEYIISVMLINHQATKHAKTKHDVLYLPCTLAVKPCTLFISGKIN